MQNEKKMERFQNFVKMFQGNNRTKAEAALRHFPSRQFGQKWLKSEIAENFKTIIGILGREEAHS